MAGKAAPGRRASTRPQLFAADHRAARGLHPPDRQASTRPQLFAADHHRAGDASRARGAQGFNEAAAIRCGSQDTVDDEFAINNRFNEAAAIRCGSQGVCPAGFPDHGPASTRPQLFAADHTRDFIADAVRRMSFNEAAAIRCGSQRRPVLLDARFRASTRPQLFAADHKLLREERKAGDVASTRPQLFAADHRSSPASCRMNSRLQRGRSYSLRITWSDDGDQPTASRFNEAAAIRCGSRCTRLSWLLLSSSFNEAAAIRCGSHAPSTGLALSVSMLQRGRSYSLRITVTGDMEDRISLELQRGRSYSLRITDLAASSHGQPRSFNEAAAIRCGSPHVRH